MWEHARSFDRRHWRQSCGAAEATGILHSEERPQGLYGSPRANALAAIDRRYNHNVLLVADLSYNRLTPRFCTRRSDRGLLAFASLAMAMG